MREIFAKYNELLTDLNALIPHPWWLVGGVVRNALLGLPTDDIDVAVDCTMEELEHLHQVVYDTFGSGAFYKSFGVVAFHTISSATGYPEYKVELTMTRAESYRGRDRHPEVAHTDLLTDLSRRDFTCNAIAWSYLSGLIDPCHGIEAIQQRQLRLIPGRECDVFTQDPLRILRAFRFAQKLGFTMDARLVKQIRADHCELDWISKERICDELMKMAALPGFADSCEQMMELGVLEEIFPTIERLTAQGVRHKNMWRHTLEVLRRVEADPRSSPLLKLTALLHDIGKPATALRERDTWTFYRHEQVGAAYAKKRLRELTFPKAEVERVGRIIELHQTPMQLDAAKRAGLRRFINKAGDVLEDLLVLAEHDHTTRHTQKQAECYQRIAELRERISETMTEDDYARFQLKIGGDRICDLLGLSPSPVIGRIKTYLTELVMSGVINNDPPALEQLVIHLKEIINYAESHQDRHRESQRAAA